MHQVVRFCLQKNPKERPNCASLLGKKFFKRDLQPDAIVKELLVNVPVVGEGDGSLERREPGCVEIFVFSLHVWDMLQRPSDERIRYLYGRVLSNDRET